MLMDKSVLMLDLVVMLASISMCVKYRNRHSLQEQILQDEKRVCNLCISVLVKFMIM